jgi:hypothetical protein
MSDSSKESSLSQAGTTKDEGSARWWEFYAVRYAMGTVVGAMILSQLSRSDAALRFLLFDPVPSESWIRLATLAVYGLVYCYLASAPILVFHASRFLWSQGSFSFGNANNQPATGAKQTKTSRSSKIICMVLLLSVIGVSGCLIVQSSVWIAFFGLFAIFCLQGWAVVRTFINKTSLYNFYTKLATARRNGAEGGIIDSYRHLREHGNSFLIVLLEAILGVVLFGVRSLVSPTGSDCMASGFSTLVVLVVWVLPAAAVWAIETVLEGSFATSEDREDPDKGSRADQGSSTSADAG